MVTNAKNLRYIYISNFFLYLPCSYWNCNYLYQVKTDDGYILSVQRIPQGREGGGGQIRQPVLLQHGVLVVI